MINLNSVRAKRRAWIIFDRLMRRFEPRIYRKSLVYLRKQYNLAASLVESGVYDIDKELRKGSREISSALTNFYKQVAIAFGTMLIRDSEKKKDISSRTVFWNHVMRWIRENVGSKVVKIDNTTVNRIKRIIRKGLDEGLSNPQIAAIIYAKTEIETIKRALRIARTETHTSANKGSYEMAKELNMKIKEWLSAKDERTRIAHRLVNGQRVKIDEPFIVDGEELMYPGDSNGSAANIINCRCTQIYRDEEKKNGGRIYARKIS